MRRVYVIRDHEFGVCGVFSSIKKAFAALSTGLGFGQSILYWEPISVTDAKNRKLTYDLFRQGIKNRGSITILDSEENTAKAVNGIGIVEMFKLR